MTVDFAKMKVRLERKLVALQEHLKEQDISTKAELYGEESQDFGESSINMSVRELERTISANEMLLLAEVQNALKRIAEGTYGICRKCGQPIPEKRLEALPWADLCVKDQAQFEHTRYSYAPL